MSRTLGMDLGTNSLGWALIEEVEGNPVSILDAGVRIFQEAVDLKTRVPKNQDRRMARAMRRRFQRRRMRRELLVKQLVGAKLLPDSADERERILLDSSEYHPYRLRALALEVELTPYQFGRILFHLNQRRGFKSGRKSGKKDEEGVVKESIAAIRAAMKGRYLTLGAYLNSLDTQRGKPDAPRYTDREMYIEEFNAVWESQQRFHPQLLTDELRARLFKTIFFQRPLRIQKYLIGKCTFEPSRPRAARALLEAQRFRILQDLGNLQVKNPITLKYRPLLPEERNKLFKALDIRKSMTWQQMRSTIGLHEGEIFNLEMGKRTELLGNQSAHALRSVLKKQWDTMTPEAQTQLVEDWLTIENEGGFLRRMQEHWGFDEPTALALAAKEPPKGYMKLSRKAINRILPYMREDGLPYDKAAEEAGYNHSRPFEHIGEAIRLGAPDNLRNPVVQKALWEVRKVVNALIREYGRPEVIRIEMARDMKESKKQRSETQRKQLENKKKRDRVKEILEREFGMQRPSREDVIRYQLWEECNMTCPYTGKTISKAMLFSPEVDIEHIIPYSISLDDSFLNKTLCIASENRLVKKNQTPYQAYGHLEKRWEEMLLRVRNSSLHKRKKELFEKKEVDLDEFVERQLNDTRYICVEVKEFLAPLGSDIQVSKGMATAALRKFWELNRILAPDGDGEKNRADHRHHALDAVVIALTSRSLFLKLAKLSKASPSKGGLMDGAFPVPPPWPTLREDIVRALDKIIVSHSPNRKISGPLHEDTIYGYAGQTEDGKSELLVKRVPLATITLPQLTKIRDPYIRQLAEQRIGETRGDLKKAFADPENPLMHHDGETPIRSVRILLNKHPLSMHKKGRNRKGKPEQVLLYGSNHHVEIFEHEETGKRIGRFVTTMEAARRVRIEKRPIVDKTYEPGWRFVMSLGINDMVVVDGKVYRVQNLDGTADRVVLRTHNSASSEKDITRLQKSINLLRCRKLTIDPVGRMSECHD